MVSDTSTKKSKYIEDIEARRFSGLTVRILLVNVVPLLVLVIGLLSLGQYQENLIQENLKTLQERAQNYAIAIEGTGENDSFIIDYARRTIRKLSDRRPDTHIRLFDSSGALIGDSQKLVGPGGVVQIVPLESEDDDFDVSYVIRYLGTELLDLLPTKTVLPSFTAEGDNGRSLGLYPDVRNAMNGTISATAWAGGPHRIVLTAAAPVIKGERVVAAVLLMDDGQDIAKDMDEVRFEVLTIAVAALSITIFLSIYLAGVIGEPLKRLAVAAEKVRLSKDRQVVIPDLSRRNDEIGELSLALREMTQALWDRMDSIEHFAADVAHEIKNPLTSLRSAVETAAKVKNNKDRERLMDIIHHDVQRLDRLISDISNASRLDAELSREEMESVDLRKILEQLVDAHKKPLTRGNKNKELESPVRLEISKNKQIFVRGNAGRLAQVFENLIGNALSFSPEEGIVTVRVIPGREKIIIEVEDEGPGIPENKLDAIFERFYSERPKEEDYGKHSGLGLAISRQIIAAHGGALFAENVMAGGKVCGACFTVILDPATI